MGSIETGKTHTLNNGELGGMKNLHADSYAMELSMPASAT